MSDQDCNSTTTSDEPRPQHPMSVVEGNSQRLRNNLIFKLGVESREVDPTKANRSQDSILGNVRITTEPLKSNCSEETGDKLSSGFWAFGAIFGIKEASEENEDASQEESHSLSSSVSSLQDANADSLRLVGSESVTSRKLKFNEQVEVCLIPKKEEYSKRIRVHLWNSPEEIAVSAHRNSVEFAAEGWDWRNVMEDENMYRCLATNELIHPVHIEQQPIE